MLFAKEMRGLVGAELREKVRTIVPDDRPDVRAHSDGYAWAAGLPSLIDCRRGLEARLGGAIDWGEPDPFD